MTTHELIIALAKSVLPNGAYLPHKGFRAINDLQTAIAGMLYADMLTIECVANLIEGSEIQDDCIILDPNKWEVSDGQADLTIVADNNREAAEEFFDGGDWGAEPCLITVSAWRVGISANGDIEQIDKETHEFTVEQPEPECSHKDGHDWRAPYRIVGGCKENPGVWGSNHGGVRITEVCMRCGCKKVTDTGDTDYGTGRQMETVTYEEGYYAEEIAAE